MMFQYYIKVVPAWYVQLDGSQYSSNQFSVTKHAKVCFVLRKYWNFPFLTACAFSFPFKVVSPLTGDNGVPGVFFPYELSPLMVRYTENQR